VALGEFIAYLATAGALGVVSSVILQLIKRLFPALAEVYAFAASMIAAVVISVAANLLLPMLPSFPPELEQFWPIVVWAAQQIWFYLMEQKPLIAIYRKT